MADPKERIIFPYDKDTFGPEDEKFLRSIRRYVGWIKVGLQAMTAENARGVTTATRVRKYALKEGFDVMWDMKLDDIPNTMEAAARNIAMNGSQFFTIHASSGGTSIAAAAKGLTKSQAKVAILAVTVLTSIDSRECVSIFGDKPGSKVVQFAKKAMRVGVQGIVCSPKELKPLADAGLKDRLVIVTPGAQPKWVPKNDQKRVMTPAQAIRAGADYLVIGRAISQHPNHSNPTSAARSIWEEIQAV